MSAEIKLQTIPAVAGATVKALIFSPSGEVWNGTAFVAYSEAAVNTYGVPMAESGTVTGFYSADFPTAITAAGTYTVVAYKQLGGTLDSGDPQIGEGEISWDGTQETEVAEGTNLITLAYAKQYLPSAIGTTYDGLIADQIAAASKAVEVFCNRGFVESDYIEYYDFPEATYALVLNHYPVTALTSVTLFPYDASPEVVVGSNYIVKSEGVIVPKPTTTGTAYFPPTTRGVPSVKVIYSAGYAVVPADVKWATAMIVQNMFGLVGTDTTKQSETIGGYSYTLRSQANYSLLLNKEVVAVLNGYRTPTLVGG